MIVTRGVLFCDAIEETILKYLIEEKNYLDAVIGLSANLFFGTCILVFKKYYENVLFIEDSNFLKKLKIKNYLTDEDVDKIVETYRNKETIDKFSYVVTLDEIKDNDYNLSIPK